MDATDFTEALANGLGDIPINTLDLNYVETGTRSDGPVDVDYLFVEVGDGDAFRLTIEKAHEGGFLEP